MSTIIFTWVRVCLFFAVTWNFTLIQLHYFLEQLVVKFWRDNWIAVIKRMLQNELANEVSSSGYLTHGSCHEEIKDVFDLFNMLFIVFLVLHELVDERIDTWKVKLWLSSKDLSDREFIIGSCYLFFLTWLFVIHLLEVILGFLSLFHGRFFHAVCIEPELLIKNSISVVGSLHVLISKGDWDNEINVIVVDNVDNQT